MTTSRMPVLFVGHGSPMNAIVDNVWSRGFAAMGQGLSPRAILSVSAHWFVNGTLLTSNALPPTIHDFGGFPQALFDVQYPARGDLPLGKQVRELLAAHHAALSDTWGIDHGTWSVLRHLRPLADVPVLQLSIDKRLSPTEHLAIGRTLAPLRDEGVLILGSGNITHNLRHAMTAMRSGDNATPPWALSFDAEVVQLLEAREFERLARLVESDAGRLAHPSVDHYLPLLYAVGASQESDPLQYPVTGWDAGSLSMRSVRLG